MRTPSAARRLAGRALILIGGVIAGAAGCGGHEPMVSMEGDSKAISQLMDEWNDAKGSPKQAAKLFATGKAPAAAQLKKYYNYNYNLTAVPRPDGETAKLAVQIYDEKKGGEPATMDWTFTKEAGAWKIETAPLP